MPACVVVIWQFIQTDFFKIFFGGAIKADLVGSLSVCLSRE